MLRSKFSHDTVVPGLTVVEDGLKEPPASSLSNTTTVPEFKKAHPEIEATAKIVRGIISNL